MHTFIERDENSTTVFFVSALVAATMLTVLTATGAEAKCKTLRLPSGERFASCGRVPRVISPYGDILRRSRLGDWWRPLQPAQG